MFYAETDVFIIAFDISRRTTLKYVEDRVNQPPLLSITLLKRLLLAVDGMVSQVMHIDAAHSINLPRLQIRLENFTWRYRRF